MTKRLNQAQSDWDRILIQGWQVTGPMYIAVQSFLLDHPELSPEDLYALKRTPKCPIHIKKPIRAFVQDHLTKLSQVLWGNKYTEDQLIDWLEVDSMTTYVNQAAATSKYREKLKHAAEHVPFDPNKDLRRSDQWGTTKAVRNKK